MNDLPMFESPHGIVDALLAEQQALTAVERFSALHKARRDVPAQSRYYRDLLPTTPVKEGEQYAFEVDLDACSGCKACVVACHTLNGLDDEETWRAVGVLAGGEDAGVQHVTTACHHCADPGCLNGCPVVAYDKDPVTGIVRHLDDQCIGCKYCMMMCPYEVPQYSKRLGIVRKCDMCSQRLAVGEAPACVQSCPNEAIEIRHVNRADSKAAAEAPDARLVAGAPLSHYTKPTSVYKGNRHRLEAMVPQDAGIDTVAESHWPLAVMLVLTQISVGVLVAERLVGIAFSGRLGPAADADGRWAGLVALTVGGVGLGIAPMHLGQPLKAWRVFLGVRTSWLSREALVFGSYMAATGGAVAVLWIQLLSPFVPDVLVRLAPDGLGSVLLSASAATGLVGVFSSAMIYVATRRPLWRLERTLRRFMGTTALMGLAGILPILVGTGAPMALSVGVALASALVGLLKMGGETLWMLKSQLKADSHDGRSKKLILAHLRPWVGCRIAGGVAGAVAAIAVAGLVLAGMEIPALVAAVGGALLFAGGELCERLLYFMSVVYDRMPRTVT